MTKTRKKANYIRFWKSTTKHNHYRQKHAIPCRTVLNQTESLPNQHSPHIQNNPIHFQTIKIQALRKTANIPAGADLISKIKKRIA